MMEINAVIRGLYRLISTRLHRRAVSDGSLIYSKGLWEEQSRGQFFGSWTFQLSTSELELNIGHSSETALASRVLLSGL